MEGLVKKYRNKDLVAKIGLANQVGAGAQEADGGI